MRIEYELKVNRPITQQEYSAITSILTHYPDMFNLVYSAIEDIVEVKTTADITGQQFNIELFNHTVSRFSKEVHEQYLNFINPHIDNK